MSIGLVYYSHNQLPDRLRDVCLAGLNHVAHQRDAERVMVVAEHIHTPEADNWHQIELDRVDNVARDITLRVLAGCSSLSADYVALVEHDVLYPSDYLSAAPWEQIEQGGFWYDCNTYRINAYGYFPHGGKLMSCCVARRDLLIQHFKKRLRHLAGGGRFVWQEPGMDIITKEDIHDYRGRSPVLDVRWGGNATGMREAPAYFHVLDGWINHADLWRNLLGDKVL